MLGLRRLRPANPAAKPAPGLGRLLRTSVPRAVAFDRVHEPDWDAGYSATSYDGLSRPVSTNAPNGSITSYHYNGLTSSVIGGSRGEDERRMLSWQRTSGIDYDFLGRKTGMSDADLGNWSYAYNTLGQLTRQTDARDQTSCLYYDDLGRMRGRVQRTDENCAVTVTDADLASSYVYDPQGRVQSVANANVSRSFSYDSYSRVNRVTVTIDSLTRSSSFSYDDYHRPTAVTYHGGEVVTTEYGSPGAAVGLRSSIHGDLVDKVSFDEAGRMTALRLPAAGNLWRTQSYYPWTMRRNGGMLESLKVGLSEGGGERLSRSYAYNSFGDITALTEETTSYTFGYDGLGRLTGAYGRTYSYDAANRLTSFNGQTYNYYDSGPYHAVDRIDDFDRFDYDANGNMTVRNKGLSGQQTLEWDAENRLSQVQDNNGDLVEQYWYDVDGARVKKVSGTTTYTFFGHYEEEVTNGTTTAISHYTFGGLRVAVKRGSALYHLHGDHLGSTSLTTAGSTVESSRAYYAYGSERAATGDLQTDRTFTGQKRDATGLMYYNARYYDPALGTFISPDSFVPDAGMVIDYNRFLYGRGNPLKFTDPSGQEAYCFMGGFNPNTKKDTRFTINCRAMLEAIGYTEEEHGKIEIVGNDRLTVKKVYEEVRAQKTRENPSPNPIVIACYSWGCPAAQETTTLLTGMSLGPFARPYVKHEPVNVDLLVMFEGEDYAREPKLGPVSENVVDAYYYYAEDAGDYVFDAAPWNWVERSEAVLPVIPADEWTWANGPDYIHGAENIPVPGGHYDFWENLPWGEAPDPDVPPPVFPF